MSSPVPLFNPHSTHPHVGVVGSLAELVETPFTGKINALCWPRELVGNFSEIEAALPAIADITSVDDDDLQYLALGPAGGLARDILIEDQRSLREHGLSPSLDLIPYQSHAYTPTVFRTDVQDWHVDSATIAADTYLCSYNVAATDALGRADAISRVDDPVTRAALLKLYGGEDDDQFRTFLRERFFDLHYDARPGAKPFTFGLGHLWRIAIQYPDCPVPPCVHRAPSTGPSQPRRLLLIS